MLSYPVIDRDRQRLFEELESASQSTTRPTPEKGGTHHLPTALTRRLQHRLHLAGV